VTIDRVAKAIDVAEWLKAIAKEMSLQKLARRLLVSFL